MGCINRYAPNCGCEAGGICAYTASDGSLYTDAFSSTLDSGWTGTNFKTVSGELYLKPFVVGEHVCYRDYTFTCNLDEFIAEAVIYDQNPSHPTMGLVVLDENGAILVKWTVAFGSTSYVYITPPLSGSVTGSLPADGDKLSVKVSRITSSSYHYCLYHNESLLKETVGNWSSSHPTEWRHGLYIFSAGGGSGDKGSIDDYTSQISEIDCCGIAVGSEVDDNFNTISGDWTGKTGWTISAVAGELNIQDTSAVGDDGHLYRTLTGITPSEVFIESDILYDASLDDAGIGWGRSGDEYDYELRVDWRLGHFSLRHAGTSHAISPAPTSKDYRLQIKVTSNGDGTVDADFCIDDETRWSVTNETYSFDASDEYGYGWQTASGSKLAIADNFKLDIVADTYAVDTAIANWQSSGILAECYCSTSTVTKWNLQLVVVGQSLGTCDSIPNCTNTFQAKYLEIEEGNGCTRFETYALVGNCNAIVSVFPVNVDATNFKVRVLVTIEESGKQATLETGNILKTTDCCEIDEELSYVSQDSGIECTFNAINAANEPSRISSCSQGTIRCNTATATWAANDAAVV